MLVQLIIFFVDFIFALVIVGILYVVYLIVVIGIFILVIFYIFKGEMGKNYDFNKDKGWVLEFRNVIEKILGGNGKRVSFQMFGGRFLVFRFTKKEFFF